MSKAHAASFRDPAGYLFTRDQRLYRQINLSYAESYDEFMRGGLYEELVAEGLIVSHQEVDGSLAHTPTAHRVIEPQRIPFISQPKEWCPAQLRDAALLTLDLQQRALARNMILKDASAHNVQFIGSRPIFIDTLSFERYSDGQAWTPYRQFCEHFLAPLALTRFVDPGHLGLLTAYPDGIPLDLASRTLPGRTALRPSLLLHVHLHARSIKRYSETTIRSSRWNRPLSRRALEGLNRSLMESVKALDWSPAASEWSEYSADDSYADTAKESKRRIVSRVLSDHRPRCVWDLGANKGQFSRLATAVGAYTLSLDADVAAVQLNYQQAKTEDSVDLLALHVDLMNPTPATGWACEEREALQTRGPADMVLALALVHHLCIAQNLPFALLTGWLASLAPIALIEFVPKSDPQAQRLLRSRPDVFPGYSLSELQACLATAYRDVSVIGIDGSQRTLLLATDSISTGSRPAVL